MKYLIVGGDSFSDKGFRSTDHPELDTSWPKWPELLAEKLGMECINLAVGGKGNEFIYSTLQDQILSMSNKDEIGLVIAAWSQCQRRDYQLGEYAPRPPNNISIPTRNWREDKIDTRGDLLYFIRRSLRYYSAFEILCERYDIPYMHFQMIDLYVDYLAGRFRGQKSPVECDESTILKIILGYDKIIDTSKFIGWPCANKLGGGPLNRIVFGEKNMNQYVISEEDPHPNADGQVALADYIYNNLPIV